MADTLDMGNFFVNLDCGMGYVYINTWSIQIFKKLVVHAHAKIKNMAFHVHAPNFNNLETLTWACKNFNMSMKLLTRAGGGQVRVGQER